MQKFIALFLSLTLFSIIPSTAFARQKGDWNAVKNSSDREIAIKTKDGTKTFGILRLAADDEIRVQIAGKKDISSQEKTFRRDEIEKIWRATLRIGGRNTGKGALIGAAIGAGASLLTVGVAAAKKSNAEQVGAAVPMFAIYGAGIGAGIGFFSQKGHKKDELLYAL